MKYISNDLLDLPVKMTVGEKEEPATLPSVLMLLGSAYIPIPNGLQLTMAELRSLNKGMDNLTADPDEDGYYVLDSEEVNVFKKLIDTFAIQVLAKHVRNVPAIHDALESSLDKKPTKLRDIEKLA